MTKNKSLIFIIIGLYIFLGVSSSYAQDTLSYFDKPKKNILKFNYSTYVLFGGDDYIVSYERMIRPNQSLSIGGGYRNFPNLLKERENDVFVLEQKKKGGFSLSAEYRFYLLQRNTRLAPDGVYIGPYSSYYKSGFSNAMEIKVDDVIENSFDLDADIMIYSVGFELGYQFIFKNIVSLDFIVFGPSWSWYNGNLDIIGDLTVNEENEAVDAIKNIVLDKYPYLEGTLKDLSVNKKGGFSQWTLGFRYIMQIGIAF